MKALIFVISSSGADILFVLGLGSLECAMLFGITAYGALIPPCWTHEAKHIAIRCESLVPLHLTYYMQQAGAKYVG